MNQNLLTLLLSDLWDDVSKPIIAWQLFALLVCVLLAWFLTRALRSKWATSAAIEGQALSVGQESFMRLLLPLLTLVLIIVAKLVMAKFQVVNVLRIAIPLVGSMALIRAMFFMLRSVFARAGAVGANLLLFEKVFALLVWAALALYITGSWPDLLDFFDSTTLPLGRHKVSLMAIFQALASVILLLVLALWVGKELETRLMSMDGVHSSLRAVAARALRALLIIVAVLLSLSMVGIDLTVLSVFGGALGVGIGLGLQKIASSYVSGFVILLDRSLKIGDMISVDRFNGRVTQINTRYTVLHGLDGTESIIPNEMLVSGVVQNFSLSDTNLRLSLRLTVTYDTDIESLIPQLENITQGVERVAQDPPPQAMMVRFAEDGIELELGFWIVDPENGRGGVISNVGRAVWQMLKEHEIQLPFARRDIRILDERTSSK